MAVAAGIWAERRKIFHLKTSVYNLFQHSSFNREVVAGEVVRIAAFLLCKQNINTGKQTSTSPAVHN